MSNGMRKNLEIKVNMDDKIITNNLQLITPVSQTLAKHKINDIIKIPKDITAKTINQNNMTQIPESHLFTPNTSKHADLKRHAGKIFFYMNKLRELCNFT